jgi:serine/threonine protein kinase
VPGTRLGPYEILSAIGAGGMGEVYKALDTRLGRAVAIKILPQGLAGDPAARERFEREARTISQINHPHICTLHDVGHQAPTHSGQAVDFLILEYLEGETLANRLSRGPLPVDQAMAIAIDICDALDIAHRSQITHRDLKPANVMLIKSATTRQGPPQAKLLDFGLAKARVAVFASRPSPDSAGPTRVGGQITTEGSLLGTIQYMAPEQIEGHEADERSDIWAFGCVLYEMLTGTVPFGGETNASTMAAILEREPRPISPALPPLVPRLWETVRVCLEKDPADRWQSARDLLRELRWIARELSPSATAGGSSEGQRPVGAARLRPWLPAAAALLVAGTGAMFWPRPASPPDAAARTGPPVIVLMDSPHPERVYDPETRKSGGTNADDLSDLLRDLPVVLLKENTSATWHRENQVLQENPALIVAHRSCFYDTTMFDPAKFGDVGHTEQFAALAHDKFDTFVGYVGQGNPQTRFVVYSRGSWRDETARAQWVTTMEQRFPTLRGRVNAMKVPLDRATFRNPTTGADIKTRIQSALKIDAPVPTTR